MERVQKLMSNYGYCSRRKAEELISKGKVKVNNKVISLGDKAGIKDKIIVDGKLVKPQRKVYLKFNKPIGCVTAVSDKRFKTVMDYVKVKERVFPVGRLDFNTTGLLILTNDGDFANKLTHPRYEIKKTYHIELDKDVGDKLIKRIEKGVMLSDGKTSRSKIKRIDSNFVSITIHEGKNRVVRRIFERFGFRVKSLHRVKIGNISLGDLRLGKTEKFRI
ncbi:rRNA pseudouridine synthase [Candidatus Woesearchaeota archaeon]|nr:rRNA pseudouridine synthase [Candidatus Woesearchaeota archaeon]